MILSASSTSSLLFMIFYVFRLREANYRAAGDFGKLKIRFLYRSFVCPGGLIFAGYHFSLKLFLTKSPAPDQLLILIKYDKSGSRDCSRLHSRNEIPYANEAE